VGFTLIELMISLVILAFLLMMGVPAFGTYLQNAKLRSTAENFYAGLQTARAEAVKRNMPVEFLLTDDSGDISSTQTATASTTGKNWIVRLQDPATLLYTFIEGRPAQEGSGQANASAVQVSSTAASITFNGFGATTLGSSATLSFTNPAGGVCAASGGPMRCLSIVVSVGGQSRLCDPAVTAAGDTRKC
jgi:type IV fimbrial biogenesis protein FimT